MDFLETVLLRNVKRSCIFSTPAFELRIQHNSCIGCNFGKIHQYKSRLIPPLSPAVLDCKTIQTQKFHKFLRHAITERSLQIMALSFSITFLMTLTALICTVHTQCPTVTDGSAKCRAWSRNCIRKFASGRGPGSSWQGLIEKIEGQCEIVPSPSRTQYNRPLLHKHQRHLILRPS